MLYDASGNLTTDAYSRVDPSRTYDGENRLITNTDTSNQLSRYTYDAAGMRVRRNVNDQETWQVYSLGGELVAEYAANAAPTSVQKEYGYRGDELLVTATSTAEVQWLIGDHLGTPRMIADKTGALSGVKRHDYLPFGEEIFAGIGGRTAQQGYAADSVRQKFTKYERDTETNLDFAEARYFSSTQGRFTSIDPFVGSMRAGDPQSFNRYSYVGNNPVNRVDPTGMWENDASQRGGSSVYHAQTKEPWVLSPYTEQSGIWDDSPCPGGPSIGPGGRLVVNPIGGPEPSTSGPHEIRFTSVKLLDGYDDPDRPMPNVLSEATPDSRGSAKLNVSTKTGPQPENGDVLFIRVSFEVVGKATLDSTGDVATQPLDGKWRLAEFGARPAANFNNEPHAGTAMLIVKMRDLQARDNSILVKVSASFKENQWGRGRLKVPVTIYATLSLKLSGTFTSVREK